MENPLVAPLHFHFDDEGAKERDHLAADIPAPESRSDTRIDKERDLGRKAG
jgi:hypothetical protein